MWRLLRASVRLARSVRVRLTLWYLAVLALVLAVFGGSVYYFQQQSVSAQFFGQLRSRVQQVALTYDNTTQRVSAPAGPTGIAPPGKLGSHTISSAEVVLLLSPQGDMLQMTGDLTQGSMRELAAETMKYVSAPAPNDAPYATLTSLTAQFPGGKSVTARYGVASTAIYQNQRVVAYLTIGIPSGIEEQLASLEFTLLWASPLVLLLAAIGGFWLAGRAMRPVQTITATARLIGATDLSRRIAIKRRDELGELAATFDTMLDRLEGAFLRQRQFTADASHELRTPLTIIELEASRLLEQSATTERQRTSLTIIQQERQHMAHLVDDLLFLARADAGSATIRHESVHLDELLLEIAERFASLAQQRTLRLLVDTLPDLAVCGDRQMLARMLGNLVENALKYSGPDGSRVALSLAPIEKDGMQWAQITISDNGAGIAAEHLPFIFERFYRADASRTHSSAVTDTADDPDESGQRAGSGLGLAIARWIAQAHDGDIAIRSVVGAGVTCTALLPLGGATSAAGD